MSFPVSPLDGQSAVVNNILYTYNATYNTWTRVPGTTVLGGVTNTVGDVIWGTANSSFVRANSAYAQANVGVAGFAYANTLGTTVTAHTNYINSIYPTTNAAFLKANTAYTLADAAYAAANAAGSSAMTTAAFAQANAGFTQANTSYDYATSAYGQANTATTNANTADTKAVNASSYANGAFTQANTAYTTSGLAYTQANTAWATANTKTFTFYQNTAPVTANTRDAWINSDTGIKYENLNGTTPLWVELGPTTAVSESPIATAAFDKANTAITTSGGTITGSLNVAFTPATTVNTAVLITAANTIGGIGYADFLRVRNSSGGTNPNKTFRLTGIGSLEVVNSAYSQTIMGLSDGGNLTLAGSITPTTWTAGQVIKDTMLDNTQFTVPTTTVATSTSDTDFISYSYTPVSSSSYLIIHVHVANYNAGDTTGTGIDSYISRIKVDGAEITWSRQYTRDNYTFRTGVLFPLTGRYTNSSTSAKTITVAVRRDTADDSINIVNNSTSLWMRITEVAR